MAITLLDQHTSISEINPRAIRLSHLIGSGAFSDVLAIEYDASIDENLKHSTSKSILQQFLDNLISCDHEQIGKKEPISLENETVPDMIESDSFKSIISDPECDSSSQRKKSIIENSFPEKIFRESSLVAKVPRHERNTRMHIESSKCLKNESNILSMLSHENVIKMHGVSTLGMIDDNVDDTEFIILDRLNTTLDSYLMRLRFQSEQGQTNSSLLDRINILFDLACAMKHVHSKQVMHRDIKPANIGFDKNGTLKIFDFGLSTTLHDKEKLGNGLYQLNSFIGSPRYMAPEVATNKPYNLKADVYSFAILMWEVLSLKKAFKGYDPARWLQTIVEGGRPEIDHSWPDSIQTLMRNCWSTEIEKRPTFDVVVEVLREKTCAW